MSLNELLARRIDGVEPFNEMPLDADIWQMSHDYHQKHRLLHSAAAHRPGIVYGLEVVTSSQKPQTILITAGVGVNSEGRSITLPEMKALPLTEEGELFVVMTYAQATDNQYEVELPVGGGKKSYCKVDNRKVEVRNSLPDIPYLELARIYRTSPKAEVKDAADPFNPQDDEINLLYRTLSFPFCYVDASIAEIYYQPNDANASWFPNRVGLYNLIREGNMRGFHLSFGEMFSPEKVGANDPILYYLAGSGAFHDLEASEVEGLRRYLDAGGTVIAEASKTGGKGGDGFEKSFAALVQRLGVNYDKDFTTVKHGHPLLQSQYVFSAPPTGALSSDSTAVLKICEKSGIIYSSFNYGAVWQGELDRPGEPDARERIRQAQEFGLNLLAFAAKRRRTVELSKF